MLLRFSGEFDNEKVSQKRTDRDFTKKRRERARLPASSPRLLSSDPRRPFVSFLLFSP